MRIEKRKNILIICICLLTFLVTTFWAEFTYIEEGETALHQFIKVSKYTIVLILIVYAALYEYQKRIIKPVSIIINNLNDMAEGKPVERYNGYNIGSLDKIGQAINKLADNLVEERFKLNDTINTGVFNDLSSIRRFIIESNKLFQKNSKEEYTMIKFDVDKFEYINEIYGHEYGNKVLNYISDTLRDFISNDERYTQGHNDNFLLLLRERNNEEILKKVEHISNKFMQIKDGRGRKLNIHFSFGIYKIEKDTDNVEQMMDKAGIAQKIAKLEINRVEPYVFYNSKIKNKIIEEQKMENLMYEALENNEFKVYLQGKNDLNSLMISGAEALVRWESSELGFISPMSFVPLFEKNGFIVEVDFFVFEEVCRSIRKWIDDGVDVKITSINQSKRHLDNDNYVARLKSIIDKYNVPAELVELEITETTVTDNVDKLIEVIDQLHKLGFKISIDDFGSGYSSLNMLKQINADVLKIDREFLNEVDESKRSKTIIKHVIKMAKELEIQTITEGVENVEQAEFLRNIGCDMAQGFLYSRPIPITEFADKYYYNE
ncbi:MAG: bifunctional diguanylate cyclase/phosphodiesterase [Clostridium sp.]|nr:bifunctional diguanylate cyclase/phosphodiesterase [Clostridium sp.]